MSAVTKARMQARVTLHGIARPHFKYPPLEDSFWWLPDVARWQAWIPEERPDRRAARKMVGTLILPSYARFRVPARVYVTSSLLSDFRQHLTQRMGGTWTVDQERLTEAIIRAERMDSTIHYPHAIEPNTTRMVALPAPPNVTKAPRARLLPSIVRGVLRDGYSREVEDDDRAPGHSTGDREAGV